MSKLEKLSITGVRSFDNQRNEIIRFFSPVTLIVGENGSGKTTIIECLKYATTGILPANSKTGGAFIHDPKLCGEKEVLAQVKLQFRTSAGQRMVATRSLQLMVKNKTRSQKTLEGQLFFMRHGERNSHSVTTAEIDQSMPSFLGVSAAVLDNVIFCHQDDSLWPLSEPANLKRKFDEIFEAQKYIKAIENLKQLRKKQNEELGKYKITEQHAREDKDRAQRAQKKADQLQAEIDVLKTQIQDLGSKMDHAQEEADKAWKQAESYAEVVGALQGKRIEANSKNNIINGLKTHLIEVPESDEWLQSTLDQFATRLEQYLEQKQAKQEGYMERREQIEASRSALIRKHNELGEHEHAKADHSRDVNRRKELIRSTAAKHGLRGYDDLTDDALVDDFIYQVKKLSKDQLTALDRARTEANAERREAQSAVNRLTERRAALSDKKKTAREQMATHDREIRDYQARADRITVDEGTKASVESKIDSVKSELQRLHDKDVARNWEEAIKDANNEVHAHEDDGSRLNAELLQGTTRAGELARLSHLQQELRDRTRSLRTLMDTHSDRINKLLGEHWDAQSCQEIHHRSLGSASYELSTAERDRDSVAREVEQGQFKLKTTRDSLERQRREMNMCESRIRKVLDGADPTEFHTVLNGMRNNLEVMKTNASNAMGLVPYFESILQTSRAEKPMCRICERGFTGETDPSLVKMRNKLTSLIRKAAAKVDEEEIKAAEAEVREVEAAAGPLETYHMLRDKSIPDLEREEANLVQQRQNLNFKMEDHDKVVERLQLAKTELDQISRSVESISKCQLDINSFGQQISDLTSKQRQQGGVRTLEEIQHDISNASEKARAAKTKLSQLTMEKDQCRSRISILELESSGLKLQLSNAVSELEKKSSFIARVEEFKSMNQKQRELIDKADSDIDKLEPEIATAQAKYEDVSQRAEAQEQVLSRKCSELAENVNALGLISEQIQSYLDRDVPAKLANTNREIKRIEKSIKDMESEQNEITREINKITEQLRDSENTKRQYHDILHYRQESRSLEALNREIADLAAQNAEVDRDRFQQVSRKHTRDFQRVSGEQQGLLGQVTAKDIQLQELRKDYNTDGKDAGKRYREAHIRVETTKAAVEDLARYAGALDQAIMKYHSLKMRDVNRIIEELWRQTYQGTDVDTIIIKTETEKATVARSHSYRVVMVKQDAEMDMRGRCSAGQKVLASIIIRLALAECFGVNCGLIALDEPTTNLDTQNIQALAKALHEVIKVRQQQSNFQLIIITHDEEFLRMMRPSDFVDDFWRVSRDERIKSVIERQKIAECM